MSEKEMWSKERLRSALKKSQVILTGCVPIDHMLIDTTARRARVSRKVEGSPKIKTASHGRNQLAMVAFVIAGSLWGAAFLFGKLAFAELPVSQVVLYRFTIASLALLPIVLVRRVWPDPRDLPLFLLTGFLIVPVTHLPQYKGLAMTSAVSASLIIGALPPLLALAAVWFYGERPGSRGWSAIGISTLGVVLIVGLPSADHSWLGDGLIFLSLFAVVGWVLLSKSLIKKYTALVATAYLMIFGTLTLLPITLMLDGAPHLNLSTGVMGSVLALGLACSALTHALWNWGLAQVAASSAGVYTNLEPVVGVLLGVLFLHESLGWGAILGGLLIITSAVVISRQEAFA